MTSYDRLPEDMREHARDYVERHEPVGGFLKAVLENNLVNAFGFADPDNKAAMQDWVWWLWNDIPSKCWGSPEKVEAWLDMHPPVTLTGGKVPAHVPGAYQNLSCCGGETVVVPDWDEED